MDLGYGVCSFREENGYLGVCVISYEQSSAFIFIFSAAQFGREAQDSYETRNKSDFKFRYS